MTDNLPNVVQESQLPQVYSKDIFDAISSSGYLPRLQLMTSNSNVCKTGEFPVNHFALISDQNHQDLGSTVDIIPLVWRPKALETGENIITVYDPKLDDKKQPTGEFARIQAKSAIKDSGCMYGVEYLIWIPSLSKCATLFCGTKSLRKVSPMILARLGKPVTLNPAKINPPGSPYTWYSIAVSNCSSMYDPVDTIPLQGLIEDFSNPKDEVVERVTEKTEDR